MTKSVLFAEYAAYHADPRNRACHAVGIPLIVMAILGLFALVSVGPTNLAVVVAALVLLYYASLDILGAAISAVIFTALYGIGIHLAPLWNVAAFIVGWVFQLIGHRYEGNKPKFLTNLIYLLVGPLFIFEELVLGAVGGKRPT